MPRPAHTFGKSIGITESVISVRRLANLIDRIVNPSQNNVVALKRRR